MNNAVEHWLTAFRSNPVSTLHDLIMGRAVVPVWSQATLREVFLEILAAQDAPLDQALTGWIVEYLGKPTPPRTPEAVWSSHLQDVFQGAAELPLPEFERLLRQRLDEIEAWLNPLRLAENCDPLLSAYRALAWGHSNQTLEQSLWRPLALRQIHDAPSYTDIGLLGLIRARDALGKLPTKPTDFLLDTLLDLAESGMEPQEWEATAHSVMAGYHLSDANWARLFERVALRRPFSQSTAALGWQRRDFGMAIRSHLDTVITYAAASVPDPTTKSSEFRNALDSALRLMDRSPSGLNDLSSFIARAIQHLRLPIARHEIANAKFDHSSDRDVPSVEQHTSGTSDDYLKRYENLYLQLSHQLASLAPYRQFDQVGVVNSLGMHFFFHRHQTTAIGLCPTPVRASDYLHFMADAYRKVGDYESIQEDSWPPIRLSPESVCVVTWESALEFASWLTEKERSSGRIPLSCVYRIPTRGEWEIAASALSHRGLRGGAESQLNDGEKDFKTAAQSHEITSFRRWLQSIALNQIDSNSTASAKGPTDENDSEDLAHRDGNVWEWCAPDEGIGSIRCATLLNTSRHAPSAERSAVVLDVPTARTRTKFGFRLVLDKFPGLFCKEG